MEINYGIKHPLYEKLKNFLANPFFVSLLIVLCFVLFIPKTEKYKIFEIEKLQWTFSSEPHNYLHYDLNNSGETELIVSGSNTAGNSSIMVLRPNNTVLDQWNFRGKALEWEPRFFIGDADGNGLNEIYLFSLVEDSIFLNYFEPFNPGGLFAENIFVDKVGESIGKADFFMGGGHFCNFEGNNEKHLVFSISAGFSLQPRNVYSFNPLSGELKKSPASGAFIGYSICVESDDPERNVILTETFAPGNLRSHMDIPYQDSSAWLMAFNKDMEFLFPPVEFPGFNRTLFTYPLWVDNELKILALSDSYAECDTCRLLLLYDLSGNEVARKDLSDYTGRLFFFRDNSSCWSNELPLLFQPETGTFFSANPSLELEVVKKVNGFPFFEMLPIRFLDFSNDGKTDFIFLRTQDGFKLLKYNLGSGATYQIDGLHPNTDLTVSVRRKRGGGAKEFSLQAGPNQIVFGLKINSRHLLKWLIILGAYVFFAALLWVSQRIYKKMLFRKQDLEKEISKLQAQLINNQLEPHFVFNALNSMNTFVLENQNFEAYQFGVKFTKLIQEALVSSDHILRPLEKELDFVENFLDLEQKRLNKFKYSIEVKLGVDKKIEVPKMIIQIFVENCVKHAFDGIKHHGLINITVECISEKLKITVKDNGIGRKAAAKKITISTRRGLRAMEQITKLHNKLFNREITHEIIDLEPKKDGQSGTLIIILIDVV